MNYDFGNPYDISQSPSFGELDQPYSARLTEVAGTVLRESPLDVMRSLGEKRDAKTGQMLSTDDAKRIATENGVQVDVGTDGIDSGELDYIIQRKKDELYTQNIMANTGNVTTGRLFAELGVGVFTSVFDPTNIALGYMPVLNHAKYAASLANASRGSRFVQRARAGAAEGLAGAAVIEPLVYGGMQELQSDYDEADVALNLFLSTAFGASMRSVGGYVVDAATGYRPGDTGLNKNLEALDKDVEDTTKRVLEEQGVPKAEQQEIIDAGRKIRDELKRTSPEYRDAIINAAITQIMTGKRLNIDELVKLGLETDYSVLSFRTEEAAKAARSKLDERFGEKVQEIIDALKGREDIPLDRIEYLQNLAASLQEDILDLDIAKNEYEIRRTLKEGVNLRDIPDLSSIQEKRRMISDALEELAENERLAADRQELQRLNDLYDATSSEAVIAQAKQLQKKMQLDRRTNKRAAEWIKAQHERGAVELAEPEASVKAQEAADEAVRADSSDAVQLAEAELEAVRQVMQERYGNSENGIPESVKSEADAIIKEADEDSAALLEAVNCALRGGA